MSFLLLLCFLIEISYTHWIFTDRFFVLKADASDKIKQCVKDHQLLLADCLTSFSLKEQQDFNVPDVDKNIRYVGENPNNYIDIGEVYQSDVYLGISKTNELDKIYYADMTSCLKDNRKCSLLHKKDEPLLWRIIGIFKEDGISKTKIVRSEHIGNLAWSEKDENINSGSGINEWSVASLKNLLNEGAFYTQGKATCLNASKDACDFSFNGLNASVIPILADNRWTTGSISEEQINDLSISDWYLKEKGENTIQCHEGLYCTDQIPRTNEITAKIGLMYPSDYAYATNDLNCLNIPLSKWNLKDTPSCLTNNWLTKDTLSSWLITPLSFENANSYAVSFDLNTGFKETFTNVYKNVYPTAYLDHFVKIAGGYGTITSPYIIQ